MYDLNHDASQEATFVASEAVIAADARTSAQFSMVIDEAVKG